MQRELKDAERLIDAFQNRISKDSNLRANASARWRGDDLWTLLKNSKPVYIQFNRKGEVIRMNNIVRRALGLPESEDKVLYFRDFVDRRTLAKASAFRNKYTGRDNQNSCFISFRNKFGETVNMEIYLFGETQEGEEFLLADLRLESSGFGQSGTFGAILESIFSKSRWPLILLRKNGRYGGWRNNRIAWISASASQLFQVESFRVTGLPLEVVSSSLSSLLYGYRKNQTEFVNWQSPEQKETEFRVLQIDDADFLLLFLIPIGSHLPGQSHSAQPPLILTAEKAGISFERLHEITDGDPEFLRVLLSSYILALQECRMEFLICMDQRSAEKLHFLHHKIKATIRTFGLKKLDSAFRKAQKWLGTDSGAETEVKTELVAEMNSLCTEAEKSLKEFAISAGVTIPDASSGSLYRP